MERPTGKLMELDKIPQEKMDNYVKVVRDLSAKERADKQIKLYSLCVCGSGKKMKFCCFRKQNTQNTHNI
jgi:hypothetical protein